MVDQAFLEADLISFESKNATFISSNNDIDTGFTVNTNVVEFTTIDTSVSFSGIASNDTSVICVQGCSLAGAIVQVMPIQTSESSKSSGSLSLLMLLLMAVLAARAWLVSKQSR